MDGFSTHEKKMGKQFVVENHKSDLGNNDCFIVGVFSYNYARL